MANTHETLTSLFSDIADAIRNKTGSTKAIVADNFPSEIASIETGSNPEVNFETPTISVSSDGLITATANGKSSTNQMTVQAAKTVTPSISVQTAVASGVYTTGAITVAGDADLVSANIVEGVNIFGVAGTCRPASDVAATQWNTKYEKMQLPTLSNTAAAVTVKAITYHNGYWYGIGNISSGDAYKIYGTTMGNLSATTIGNNRNYPATGIACDGTYVWVCCSSGSYSNRKLLRQSISDFRSNSTSVTATADTDMFYNDICHLSGTYTMLFGGYESGAGAAVGVINGTTYTKVGLAANTPTAYVSGCEFGGCGVAVTANGTLGYFADFTLKTYKYRNLTSFLNGAQKINKLGDYLCVVCARDDGTHLYYHSGDIVTNNVLNPKFSGFKIADEKLTIVGMAYAGGLYTVIGYNSAGETKVWQSVDIEDHGMYGKTMALTAGYTPRAMATDGTNVCVLADNGASVQKALVTIE